MFSTINSQFQNKTASSLHTEAQSYINSNCLLSTLVLHQRLVHPNSKTFNHVLNSCPSFKSINENKTFDSCDACKMEKKHKLHFVVTETKTKKCIRSLIY